MTKFNASLLTLLLLAGCSSGHNIKSSPTAVHHHHTETSLSTDFEKNVGDRVFFSYDSSDITQHSKDQLQKDIVWLKEHSKVKVTVEGHADERGTREYNIALGERRAEAVKKFLIHHGIDSSRLDTISYGKERPAVIGNDEEAWKQNRRAVLSIR